MGNPLRVFHWTTPEAVKNILGKKEGLKVQAGPDTKTVGNRPGVYTSIRDDNPMLKSRQSDPWSRKLTWVDITDPDYNKTVPLEINIPDADALAVSRPGHITGDSEVRVFYDDIPAEFIKVAKLPEGWRKRIPTPSGTAITPPGWKPGDSTYGFGESLNKFAKAARELSPDARHVADNNFSKHDPSTRYNWDWLYDTGTFDEDAAKILSELSTDMKSYAARVYGKRMPGDASIDDVINTNAELKKLKTRPIWTEAPEDVVKLNTGRISRLPYDPEDYARLVALDRLEYPSTSGDGLISARQLQLADMPAYRGKSMHDIMDDIWLVDELIGKHDLRPDVDFGAKSWDELRLDWLAKRLDGK